MGSAVAAVSKLPSIAVPAGRHQDGPAKASKPKLVPALIVVGRDDTDKPHASSFAEADVTLARKAAELMGMYAVAVESDALKELAVKLPEGRVFASGKAFVPFVKASLFEQLLPHLGEDGQKKIAARSTAAATDKSAQPATEPDAGKADGDAGTGAANSTTAGASSSNDAKPTAPKYPTDWSQIAKGSEVLALEKPGEAWYEAIVVEERSEGLFTLRWRDFEGYPVFVRRREHIGLIHPSFRAV